MTLLLDAPGIAVHHADWRELAAVLPRREDGTVCDALVVDAPYSERTHAGHDAVSEKASALGRRPIDYPPWSEQDVSAFVSVWAPLVRGWFVTLTDDVLSVAWRASLEMAGRCGFPPLPFVQFGSRVRLCGDGPSSITTQIVVARPRRRPFSAWCSLHRSLTGAYILPRGFAERPDVVGGKPLWIMERLVEDYSRPGDTVCDPCAGAFTTVLAAARTGRIGIGGDVSREHVEIGIRRLARPIQQPLFIGGDSCREHAEIAAERLRDVPTAERAGTLALFRGVG